MAFVKSFFSAGIIEIVLMYCAEMTYRNKNKKKT